MEDSVSMQLRNIVLENGLSFTKDASRVERFLQDRCGQSRKEISAALSAVREGTVDSLRKSLEPGACKPSLNELVKDLEDNQGLAHDAALWAVQAWATALGISLQAQKVKAATKPMANQKRWPVRQRLTIVAAFAAALCGVLFWFVSDPQQAQVEAKTDAADARTNVGVPTATQPAVAPKPPANSAALVAVNPEPVKEDAVPAAVDKAARKSSHDIPIQAPSLIVHPVEVEIPNGTVLSVQLGADIDSSTASEGDRVNAALAEPVTVDGSVVVPRGSKAVVEVAAVKKAGRLRGSSDLTLQLVALVVRGKEYSLVSQPYQLKAGSVGKIFEKGKGVSIAANETIGFLLGNSLKISNR